MGSVGKTESYQDWRRRWHFDYGVTPESADEEDSLASLSNRERKMLDEEMEKFVKEFPEVKDMYISLSLKDKLDDGASALYTGDLSNVSITRDIFNNADYGRNLEKRWYAGVLTTYHPEGTTKMSSLPHELGHGLINYVARVTTPDNGDYVDYLTRYSANLKQLETTITENAAKAVGSSHVQLSSRISHYATTNRAETIAEAVSDYMANGNRANVYSKAIVKELKKQLRRVSR